jgi:hypothetical protein
MLEFFQDNVTWLFYVLFFLLMLRMHMGHSGHGVHRGGDHKSAQSTADPRSKGTTATIPERPESRSTSDGGHSH